MPLMTAADCVAFCFLVASAVAVAMAIWLPRSKLWKGLPTKPENRLEPKAEMADAKPGSNLS